MQADIEPIVKNLPEIIKQASQSQLGILALLVILAFGLAIFFFRKATVRWRVVVFFAFFGGVIAYAIEISLVVSKPVALHYVGRTLDQVTHKVVSEASVLVSVGTTSNKPYFTDSLGSFSFWLARSMPTDDATVSIEHEKYQSFTRIVPSDVSSQLGDILLTPVAQAANTATPQPTPTPPASQPPVDNAPLPAAAGNPPPAAQPSPNAPGPAGSRAAVPTARGLPPNLGARAAVVGARAAVVPHVAPQALPQLATALQVLVPKVVEASSGQQISGKGKDWSTWYQVRVGAAPAGYTIDKVAFWLTGDRSCGAWAECQEISKSDTEVAWQFRLQGHDEWGAPPQTYSTGTLRVTYRPK